MLAATALCETEKGAGLSNGGKDRGCILYLVHFKDPQMLAGVHLKGRTYGQDDSESAGTAAKLDDFEFHPFYTYTHWMDEQLDGWM